MRKLLALVLTTILCLYTLSSCGILGFHFISYPDVGTEMLLMDGYAPKWAKPGDTVVLRTGPIMDADLELYANGVKLKNTHNDSDYWEYTFIMPDEDVVITHDIVGGFDYKECVNHIDKDEDGICDDCRCEYDECNHQWDDGIEIQGGSGGYVMEYTCLLCGIKKRETITIIPPP